MRQTNINPITAYFSRLDKTITRYALLMIISFLVIIDYDSKFAFPLLIWAIAGVYGASVDEKIACLFVLASWFSLWGLAFARRSQNLWYFIGSGLCLWLVIGWQMSREPLKAVSYWSFWFWIPSLVFIYASVSLLLHFVAIRKGGNEA